MLRNWCSPFFLALALCGLCASADEATAPSNPHLVSEKPKSAVTKPVYVPPRRGAPTTRVGGGTRSGSGEAPSVEVLAPPHTGLTGKAAPTLYWWLSQDYTGTLELVVTQRDETEPLLKQRAEDTFRAGVHALDLAAQNVTLEAGEVYQWSVALVRDAKRRSHDVVAIATIERGDAPTSQDAAELAAAGLWYDAIDALSREVESSTDGARAARAELLEQGDLPVVAAWDREAR